MNKICTQCKEHFAFEAEDFDFFKRMGVSVPELCPQCGIGRVMNLRNEHTLYRGTCAACKKTTLSIYHPNSPYVVYCHDCWWSDNWDASIYAQDYDPNRPLLDQFYELQKKVPREAVMIMNSTNCDFTNNVRHSKDCYMTDLSTNSEGVHYSEWIVKGKDVFDCKKVNEGELIIECIDVINCARSAYLQDCADSSECFFSYDLKGCTNCIFSNNLRNKSYYVSNKKVSKEEYERLKKEIFSGSYVDLQKHIARYNTLRGEALHKYSQILNSKDCVGGFIEDSNRLDFCFDAIDCQDVKASASIGSAKSGMYSYSIGWPAAEYFFGACSMRGGNNVKFSYNIVSTSNSIYCDSIISCTDAIACVGIKHKEFAILNKSYSKEEYLAIKAQLEKKGELAKFPGPEFSTFGYNEAAAYTQYPLTQEQATAAGYRWQKQVPITTDQETIAPEAVPDNLKDINDGFLKQIFKCAHCSRNYRIVARELELYRQFSLPLPRQCPQCRMLRRREERTPYKLWPRHCMNTACPNTFKSPYSPESTETIYCETCYQSAVV